MASASIPHTNVGSGCTIITQVVPSSTAPATVEQISPQTKILLETFLKREPKALGTVQIMIGVITILFGIVITVYPWNFSACSGVVFWSSMFYISTGSLAVSGSNTLKTCVVKATLMMNILSIIIAGIAIIILYLDLTVGKFLYPCNDSPSLLTESRTNGITGVLLFFSALQFAISVAILIFTCEAICANGPTMFFGGGAITISPELAEWLDGSDEQRETRARQSWEGCRLAIRRTPFKGEAAGSYMVPSTDQDARAEEVWQDGGEDQPGDDYTFLTQQNRECISDLREQVAQLQMLLVQFRESHAVVPEVLPLPNLKDALLLAAAV
ncbi:high affinity immunoglobulin epsilon receptor subunit beta-like [Clarias gariepinus]|uniref:high affinity immunoglobulin epsilon receptor subunit beta-like n=1 Tax=Clarias gariepinus TaxID=13013 RepID=UPI00234D3230|nr:high affinity immunoglobulin epsilon receptor subunit beta-like [Clarias gariepinus]